MTYTDVTLDHFYNPRHARRLPEATHIGKAGDPFKGAPFMVLYLRIDGDKILEAAFQTYGCAAAIASGSVLCEGLTGTTLAGARQWDWRRIDEALGGLPRDKTPLAVLAADVLRDALRGVS